MNIEKYKKRANAILILKLIISSFFLTLGIIAKANFEFLFAEITKRYIENKIIVEDMDVMKTSLNSAIIIMNIVFAGLLITAIESRILYKKHITIYTLNAVLFFLINIMLTFALIRTYTGNVVYTIFILVYIAMQVAIYAMDFMHLKTMVEDFEFSNSEKK